MQYAVIQVYAPLSESINNFTYRIPENLINNVFVGDLVVIPFSDSNLLKVGIVTKLTNKKPDFIDTKEIIEVLPYRGLFGQTFFKLFKLLNEHSKYPFSYTIYDLIPSWMTKRDGISKRFLNGDNFLDNHKHYLANSVTPTINYSLKLTEKTNYILKLVAENPDKQVVVISNNYLLLDNYETALSGKCKICIYHPYVSKKRKTDSFYEYVTGKANLVLASPELLMFTPSSEQILVLDLYPELKSDFDISRKAISPVTLCLLKAKLLNFRLIDLSYVPNIELASLVDKPLKTSDSVPQFRDLSLTQISCSSLFLEETKKVITTYLSSGKKVILISLKYDDDKTYKCIKCHTQLVCSKCQKVVSKDNSTLTCDYCGADLAEITCPSCQQTTKTIPFHSFKILAHLFEKSFKDYSHFVFLNPNYSNLKKLDIKPIDIMLTTTNFINYQTPKTDEVVYFIINFEPWQNSPHYASCHNLYTFLHTLSSSTIHPIYLLKQTNSNELDLLLQQSIPTHLHAELESRKLLSLPPTTNALSVIISGKQNFLKTYQRVGEVFTKLKSLSRNSFLNPTSTKQTKFTNEFVICLKDLIFDYDITVEKIKKVLENLNLGKDYYSLIINDVI